MYDNKLSHKSMKHKGAESQRLCHDVLQCQNVKKQRTLYLPVLYSSTTSCNTPSFYGNVYIISVHLVKTFGKDLCNKTLQTEQREGQKMLNYQIIRIKEHKKKKENWMHQSDAWKTCFLNIKLINTCSKKRQLNQRSKPAAEWDITQTIQYSCAWIKLN